MFTALEQARDQRRNPGHSVQNAIDFIARQHYRPSLRLLRAGHVRQPRQLDFKDMVVER